MFELRNLGDAPGPPGVTVLMGLESGGLRIAWTNCGVPPGAGETCVVWVEILRAGASAVLSVPGGGSGIRVGGAIFRSGESGLTGAVPPPHLLCIAVVFSVFGISCG